MRDHEIRDKASAAGLAQVPEDGDASDLAARACYGAPLAAPALAM
ncbi:hypothetical protein [Bordetella genomosp. 10]|nr:hypothetical protein [Bordetella genomosp. 10]